jgi:nitrite reductase/ring-hydroxylating ferredoxin subunit
VVCDRKVVRCPWHHWNWSLESGTLDVDPHQGLRTYEVAVDGDDVIVRV